MSTTIAAEDLLCNYCALRLHDRCRGRCLCDHEDPIVMAAQALAWTMLQFRAFLPDATYEQALESFDTLSKMLPGVDVAGPTLNSGAGERASQRTDSRN